jgi:hypothetical protein
MKAANVLRAGRFSVSLLFIITSAVAARASFHEMQIEQVTGGVNGDTTAQAIQLRMRASFQDLVSQGRLVAFDATGANPIIILDLTNNVANGSLGDRVLIVSSNFVNSTSPAVVPDFVLTQLIPTSYLAAGRLVWESDGGTIYWSLSWGGTNYSGSSLSNDPFNTNDADDNYGPPFAGPLPSTSTAALLFTNSASAPSLSNVVDYVVSAEPAVFTNNARQAFTVVPAPRFTAVTREGNNIRITWTAAGGRSYIVQATPGGGSGGFSTVNFTNISATITIPGTGNSTTNHLDLGGATNVPSRYYRVRLVP